MLHAQRLDLRSLNKYIVLRNLSICYTWKNIRQDYNKKNLKTIATSFNYLTVQCQIFKFISNASKKCKTLAPYLLIHIYINRINNRPEKMKFFGSTTNLLDKTKNDENVPSLEVTEVLLANAI